MLLTLKLLLFSYQKGYVSVSDNGWFKNNSIKTIAYDNKEPRNVVDNLENIELFFNIFQYLAFIMSYNNVKLPRTRTTFFYEN